jgi:hypothetical protein
MMGVLESLNLNSVSTGPATDEESLSRAPMNARFPHLDRRTARRENAAEVDDAADFEGYLNGFVEAGVCSQSADLACVHVSQQRLVTDESVEIDLQPAMASRCAVGVVPASSASYHGTRASIGALAGSTEPEPSGPVLPQSGLPADPFSLTTNSANVTAGVPIELSSSEQPVATGLEQIDNRTQSATLGEELQVSGPMPSTLGQAVTNAISQSSLAETGDSTIAVRSDLSDIAASVAGRTSELAQPDTSTGPRGRLRDAIARADASDIIQGRTVFGFTGPSDRSESANRPATEASVAEFAETDLTAATGRTLDVKRAAGERPLVGLSTQVTHETLGLPRSSDSGKIGPTEADVNGSVQRAAAANEGALENAAAGLITFETSGDTDAGRSHIVAATIAQLEANDHRDGVGDDVGGRPRQGVDSDGRGTFAESVLAGRGPIDATADRAIDRSISTDSRRSPAAAEQVFGEIASRVELSQRDGRTDFRMRLDPPGLGTVHVHLTALEHSVSARLVVNDEAARQAIESQLQTLRESLAGVGVSLERFDVASDGGGSRGAWQWQQPEPLPTGSAFRVQGSVRRPGVTSLRPTMGAIDVVV